MLKNSQNIIALEIMENFCIKYPYKHLIYSNVRSQKAKKAIFHGTKSERGLGKPSILELILK
jgi:hypothetical protein